MDGGEIGLTGPAGQVLKVVLKGLYNPLVQTSRRSNGGELTYERASRRECANEGLASLTSSSR
jgi:hypothetical protein